MLDITALKQLLMERANLNEEQATRAAASRADLAALEHTLLGDGWEPLAGSIDGLPRFQRRQE